MLRLLSGRTHQVLTGVCVRLGGRSLVHVEPSRVRMAPLSEAEIDWYVATGEPLDKAGAYAAQGKGAEIIAEIEGSFSNVVGLPMEQTIPALARLGIRAGRPNESRQVPVA